MRQFIFTLALMFTFSACGMQARVHHKQHTQTTETVAVDTADDAGIEAVSDTVGTLDTANDPDTVDTAAADNHYSSDHDFFDKTVGNFLYHNTWVLVLLAIAAVVVMLLLLALPIIILVLILRWLIGNHNKRVDAEWNQRYHQPTAPYAEQPQPAQQQGQPQPTEQQQPAQQQGQPQPDTQQPQTLLQQEQTHTEQMGAQTTAQQSQFNPNQQQTQQQMPPQFDNATTAYLNKQWQKGVRNTALGVGLIFLFLCIHAEPLVGIGILVACCGLGQMVIAKWPSYKSKLHNPYDTNQHNVDEGPRR